jgi:hypothetical protein
MHMAFDKSINDTLGPAATTQNFPAEDITPDHDAFDPDILDLDPDQGVIEGTPEYMPGPNSSSLEGAPWPGDV